MQIDWKTWVEWTKGSSDGWVLLNEEAKRLGIEPTALYYRFQRSSKWARASGQRMCCVNFGKEKVLFLGLDKNFRFVV